MKLFEDKEDFEDFVNFVTGMGWIALGLFIFAGLAVMVMARLSVI